MALIVADRVKETATTTGTGAFTLAGAMTGYRAFSAVCATADTCYYTIQAVDADGVPTGAWEVGLGTYSSANTLTRTTVLSSSTGSAVDFSAGAKQVWIDLAASQVNSISPKITSLQRSTNQSIANSSWTTVSWDTTAVRDDVGAFSAGAPTLLTCPTGYTKVRLTLYTSWANNSTGLRYSGLNINTVSLFTDQKNAANESGGGIRTPWMPIAATQSVYALVYQTSGGNLNLSAGFGPSRLEAEWLP